MADYAPPLQDMLFLLDHVIGLETLEDHPDLGKIDRDIAESILIPAGELAAEVLAPLNHSGDKNGAIWKDGVVTTATGFKEAYHQYCEGGWNAVPFPSEYGGQGLPWLLAFPVQEMWQAANMSFGLCPLLNQGAVEAILSHGSDVQKQTYLEKLISGEWTGTMNLTEPQAGSDLAAIRTRAEPQADGSYKISGQKIFITYGEHDMTDNIIHLVLARTPHAPEGVKGISLFIVPKFLTDGSRNDVLCTGIEHKLGIHASPTCIMQFGDKGGAIGYLVGQENEGLKYMFTMMNNARLSVGLQGVAIAERAYQKALAYAQDRQQGTSLQDKNKRIEIIHHPDIKRMMMHMKAQIEAFRALTYEAALHLDKSEKGDKQALAIAEFLTPLVKSGATDMAVDVTSTALQIHGGMGFIEETGIAQLYRDARILPIYEGTNGIQSMDLMFRKILRDQGATIKAYLSTTENVINDMKASSSKDISLMALSLDQAVHSIYKGLTFITHNATQVDVLNAISVPFLKAMSLYAGGVMMGRSALAAIALSGEQEDFYQEKINTTQFYVLSFLPFVTAHIETMEQCAPTILSYRSC